VRVPVLDLQAQYGAIGREIDEALRRVCRNAWFKLGPEVEKFESAWAARCGAAHCAGVNSGTSALHLALLAAGVGPGDEVITSPFSFFATAEAIHYTGARAVFVDIDPATYCMDPGGLAAAATERTRAVMPVHLFGHPCDMQPILDFAASRGLVVVEDAAQAHGALYRDRPVGALGDAGAFSFYPTKNLGAYGEAGTVVTNSDALCEAVRLLRNHGQSGGYVHSCVGYNYRMAGLQGAVLNVKLPLLDGWNARRRDIARTYTEAFEDLRIVTPGEADYAVSAWHLYVVRCEGRDALKAHLEGAGVAAVIHYPVLIPQLEAMQSLGPASVSLAEAERAAKEVLSLPIYPEMTAGQVDYVIERVREFFGS
jgi:dTDP-4-amino-4,6-dideoxygalactose transaminase